MVSSDASLLNHFGAALTTAMGVLGLAVPRAAARLTGLEGATPAGRSEFRATFGGLFVMLGLAPLATGEPLLYAFAGLCWLGAALGRALSLALDDAATRTNFGALAFEAAMGALLLSGPGFASLLAAIAGPARAASGAGLFLLS